MSRSTEGRPSGWWFPARTTAYFLIVAAISLAIISLLGLNEIRNANAEDSEIRIDRAGRAAAALFEERVDDARVMRDDAGATYAITLTDEFALMPGSAWEELLDTTASVNQGAANLFRFNESTRAFDRIATTFLRPDGTRAGDSMVEPGLIQPGHPAYAALEAGETYVGEVPVAGRLRLAKLTPIIGTDGDVLGILAVDVGWVDDLNRINGDASRRAITVTALLLAALAAVGILVMFMSFRPLHRLTDYAHALGTPGADEPIALTNRGDEIGYLAKGLAKVADLQKSLQHRAFHDMLTGVGNRAALVEELRRRFDSLDDTAADGCALLVVDLDGFKEVNDGLGHQAGDEVLVAVARSLQEALEPGEFLARLGGDEFAVLSSAGSLTTTNVHRTAERIADAASGTFDTSSGRARLGSSVGVALIPAHGDSPAAALSHADLALYEVKRAGGGNHRVYEKALSETFQRRLHLATELRTALDHDALHVEYQPMFDADGQVRAVEALARWTHDDEGAISPVEFIPVAENLGLIEALGERVLNEACRDIATWALTFEQPPMACVNISTMQLANPAFPATVQELLARHRLRPEQLCLELTESVLVPGDTKPHRRTLEELSNLGVKLAIDDFGTGYSSLNYLHQLNVDQVKIDRTFMKAAVDNPQQAQLVDGIVGLARNLELSVVLEGIETESELELAQRSDYDLLQGFLLARPVRAEAIVAMLDERNEHLRLTS